MGGECLNTGCVPVQGPARRRRRRAGASAMPAGSASGPAPPTIDFAAVRAHVRAGHRHHRAARLRRDDGRLRRRDVIAGEARFLSPYRVAVADRVLTAPRIVLATGSRPAVPPIPGLSDVAFLTNETLWDLDVLPQHLAILGAGAVGVEMAQAFRRLGAAVTLIDAGHAARPLRPGCRRHRARRLRAEGVDIRAEHDDHPHRARPASCTASAARRSRPATSWSPAGRTPVTDTPRSRQGRRRGRAGRDRHRRPLPHHGQAYLRHRRLPRRAAPDPCGRARGLRRRAEHRARPARQGRTPPPAASDLHRIPNWPSSARPRPRRAPAGAASRPRSPPFADDDRAVAEGDTAGFVKLVLRPRPHRRASRSWAPAPATCCCRGRRCWPARRPASRSPARSSPTRPGPSAPKQAAFASLRASLFSPAAETLGPPVGATRRIP